MRCPHCGQDDAVDHAGCVAYLSDLRTLSEALTGMGQRCADAAVHVLGMAPVDRRLTVALAVVHAWRRP